MSLEKVAPGKKRERAEHAGIHGNPESGNHPKPLAQQGAWKGKGPANREDVGPAPPPNHPKHPPPMHGSVDKGMRPTYPGIRHKASSMNRK